MKVGTYPGTVLAQGSFTATVTSTNVAGRDAGDNEWRLYFEDGTLLEAGSTLDLRPAAEETADAPATAASSELPTEPALHTAFPNPFGTAATVPFDVAESSPVRVAVYDLLGREVAVLVDGTVEAGRYTATLDGRSLSNGVYLVRMTTGAFVQTQRVTVVK